MTSTKVTPATLLTQSFVAGDWVTGDTAFPVENPADESIVGEPTATPAAEVRRAIEAARAITDRGNWADLSGRDRAEIVLAFLDHLESERKDITTTVVAEAGQPWYYAEQFQVAGSIAAARNTVELFRTLPEEVANPVPVDELVNRRVALSVQRYSPIGVVAAITPYNAAMTMGLQKLVPALLTGNAVVLRPSPLTPLSSLYFGRAAEAAGLPPGVLSVVIEPGSEGAELLTSHVAVDMVSFTGSTAVGKRILAQAASTVKRVTLELGGKSAQIYLPDALERVVAGAVAVATANAGQVCVAASRMIVPQEAKADVVATVAEAYAQLTVGPPSDPAADVGPLISANQCAHVLRILDEARSAGGTVATGGARPTGLDRGYYMEPTVVDAPDNANPAAKQEFFGPVLTILGYRDLDHAVEIANDTEYGLSNQVYGADIAAATAVARRLRSGAVNVNTGVYSAYASGGGHKQSGLGRERGPEGIRDFQESTHLAIGELPR